MCTCLAHFVVVHELADSDLRLKGLDVKIDVLVHFPFLIREGSHGLPDPRNEDLSIGAN